MFISFEGIDGSGKSTQARMLEGKLRDEGYPTLLVREPGGTALSEHVRALLLDKDISIAPVAELLLFSSARAQLVEERIRPALNQGIIVLCDRFFDSTTAYQGAGRAVADEQWLQEFNRFVTSGLVPERTFIIKVPLEVAVERQAARFTSSPRGRNAKPDRMELGGDAFYRRIIGAYEDLASHFPERILEVDGMRPPDQVAEEIWKDIKALLTKHGTTTSG